MAGQEGTRRHGGGRRAVGRGVRMCDRIDRGEGPRGRAVQTSAPAGAQRRAKAISDESAIEALRRTVAVEGCEPATAASGGSPKRAPAPRTGQPLQAPAHEPSQIGMRPRPRSLFLLAPRLVVGMLMALIVPTTMKRRRDRYGRGHPDRGTRVVSPRQRCPADRRLVRADPVLPVPSASCQPMTDGDVREPGARSKRRCAVPSILRATHVR